MNIHVKVFLWTVLLGLYLGVEFLDHRVTLYLIF